METVKAARIAVESRKHLKLGVLAHLRVSRATGDN